MFGLFKKEIDPNKFLDTLEFTKSAKNGPFPNVRARPRAQI